MKTFLVTIAVLAFLAAPVPSDAQIPLTLSHQGVLTDPSGNPKPDGSYDFVFSLYLEPAGGTPVWSESKTLQTERGLFSTILGDQTPLDPSLFSTPLYLGIQVGTEQLPSRIPLTSSAYSFASKKAEVAELALSAPAPTNVVNLQSSTPGTQQTGHINISGTGKFQTLTPYEIQLIHQSAGSWTWTQTPNGWAITFPGGKQIIVTGEFDLGPYEEVSGIDVLSEGLNVFQPTSDITGITVRQTSAVSPTSDVFKVTDASGTTDYLKVGNTGNAAFENNVDVNGILKIINGILFPLGAGAGKVLTSDVDGNATWQPATGGMGGGGSSNFIAKFTGPTTLGNSILSESGNTISVQGNWDVSGSGTFSSSSPGDHWIRFTAPGAVTNWGARFMPRVGNEVVVMDLDRELDFDFQGTTRLSITDAVEVNGILRIINGILFPLGAGAGKVLTSDVDGNATWQPAAGGMGGGGSSNFIAKFTGPTTLGNSILSESGNTISVQGNWDVSGLGTFNSTGAGNEVVVFKGASGQTADLSQWIDFNSFTVAKVAANGSFATEGDLTVKNNLTVQNGTLTANVANVSGSLTSNSNVTLGDADSDNLTVHASSSFNSSVSIRTGAPGNTGLEIRGAPGQEAFSFQVVDADGSVRAWTDNAGVIHGNTLEAEGAVVTNGGATIGDAGSDIFTVHASSSFDSPVSVNNRLVVFPTPGVQLLDVIGTDVYLGNATVGTDNVIINASTALNAPAFLTQGVTVATGAGVLVDVAGSDVYLGNAASGTDAITVNGTLTSNAVSMFNNTCTVNTGGDANRGIVVNANSSTQSAPLIDFLNNLQQSVTSVFANGQLNTRYLAVTNGFVNTGTGGPPLSLFGGAPGDSGAVLSLASTVRVASLTGNLGVDGSICATGPIGPCSDSRLKRNIKLLEGALGKVQRLQGVAYEWRRDEFPEYRFGEGNQIGLIAQNVEKVFPEAVSVRNDGYKMVDYGRLTAVLIEAVKEQQKQIEGLKTKVESLESFVKNQFAKK